MGVTAEWWILEVGTEHRTVPFYGTMKDVIESSGEGVGQVWDFDRLGRSDIINAPEDWQIASSGFGVNCRECDVLLDQHDYIRFDVYGNAHCIEHAVRREFFTLNQCRYIHERLMDEIRKAKQA